MSKMRIGLLVWTILVSSATAFAADLLSSRVSDFPGVI